jgi:hypothetical protein
MKNVLALLTITFALHAHAQRTCSTFDTGLAGWTEDETTCRNVGGSVRCDDDSGGSNLVAPAGFHGNWVTRVDGCGRLCFDVDLIESGLPENEARLGIVITSGTQRASFRSNLIAEGSGWRRVCAPIASTPDGAAPRAADGQWILGPGTNWNTLIANVTSLELPIDLVTGNEEILGFDNVCFHADPPPEAPAIVGPDSVCGPPQTFCVAPQEPGTTIAWGGTDVAVAPATGACTTVTIIGPLPVLTATATRNGCSTTTTRQLHGCPTPIGCAMPSFSVRHHTLTRIGADDLQSDLLLHVPGSYERITLTLVSASVRSPGDDCGGDGSYPLAAHFADAQSPPGVTLLAGPPSPRELAWSGGTAPDVPLAARIRGTQVGLPGACAEELTFCFRYRVTGGDCATCEQTICRTVVRE